jgi:hypothetical protein
VLLPSVRRSTNIQRASDSKLAMSFLIGGIAGALAIVPLLLLMSALLQPFPTVARVGAWTVVGTAIVVVNVRTGGCPLVQTRRQIGQEALVGQGTRGAFRFGAALGTGIMTYTPSCAPHLLALSLVLLPVSVVAAASAAMGFGVGRGIGVLGRALSPDRVRYEQRFQRVVRLLARGLAAAIVFVLLGSRLWIS